MFHVKHRQKSPIFLCFTPSNHAKNAENVSRENISSSKIRRSMIKYLCPKLGNFEIESEEFLR